METRSSSINRSLDPCVAVDDIEDWAKKCEYSGCSVCAMQRNASFRIVYCVFLHARLFRRLTDAQLVIGKLATDGDTLVWRWPKGYGIVAIKKESNGGVGGRDQVVCLRQQTIGPLSSVVAAGWASQKERRRRCLLPPLSLCALIVK